MLLNFCTLCTSDSLLYLISNFSEKLEKIIELISLSFPLCPLLHLALKVVFGDCIAMVYGHIRLHLVITCINMKIWSLFDHTLSLNKQRCRRHHLILSSSMHRFNENSSWSCKELCGHRSQGVIRAKVWSIWGPSWNWRNYYFSEWIAFLRAFLCSKTHEVLLILRKCTYGKVSSDGLATWTDNKYTMSAGWDTSITWSFSGQVEWSDENIHGK